MRVKEESEKTGLRSWHPVSSFHGKQKWKRWKQSQILFSWAPKSLQTITAAMTFKDTFSLSESYDKPRQHIKKQRYHFVNKDASNQSYSFFQESCVDVRVGPQTRLSAKELMLSNCGAGEDSC